jgi:hypothetical protein
MPATKYPLGDVLELASIERARWASLFSGLRASGVPLNLDDDVEKLTLLQQLRAKRDKQINALGTLIEERTSAREDFEKRSGVFTALSSPTDDEKTTHTEARSAFTVAEEAFGVDFAEREAEIKHLDQRIAEQEILEQRRQAAATASTADARVTSEPLTYRKDIGRTTSYFRDLASVHRPGEIGDPEAARERLARHAQEMEVEVPNRAAERERRAKALIDEAERAATGGLPGIEQRGLDGSAFEKRVNPNRTDGQGGFAIPPLWLIDDYITLQRAGRVASNLTRQVPLPEGTDSINIPRLATGTAVAAQMDGGAVASQDFTDDSIEAKVKTIAGQQDVAIQLLDQSPGEIVDLVIMGDLMADYNRQVDRDVVYGAGGSAKIKGIWPATNWGATTVTSAAAGATGVGFFQTQGAMLSKLATSRFSTDGVHFLMPPRRWFWYATALDGASGTSGKPLVGADGFGPFETEGLHAGTPAEGLVGRSKIGPFNYYASANVPTTASAAGVVPDPSITAGAFDQVLAAKWDDLWLFEGAMRTRVLDQVLSGSLQIRFQAWNYVAFLQRYASSVVIAQGAGLPAPTGAIDTAMTF